MRSGNSKASDRRSTSQNARPVLSPNIDSRQMTCIHRTQVEIPARNRRYRVWSRVGHRNCSKTTLIHAFVGILDQDWPVPAWNYAGNWCFRQDFAKNQHKIDLVHALYMQSETGLARTGLLPAETRDRPSPDNGFLGK